VTFVLTFPKAASKTFVEPTLGVVFIDGKGEATMQYNIFTVEYFRFLKLLQIRIKILS